MISQCLQCRICCCVKIHGLTTLRDHRDNPRGSVVSRSHHKSISPVVMANEACQFRGSLGNIEYVLDVRVVEKTCHTKLSAGSGFNRSDASFTASRPSYHI
ncbi:MAG: hypothetical protein J07HR59_00665 [Halorubrum sp. J07HR59]|nr:MAG: hypothetical protein J07HR59_00665 [Halorubrum sp. J07HR59]